MVKATPALWLPLFISITLTCSAQAAVKPKYSADVPDSIITSNKVNSKYLGELTYADGAPNLETFQKSCDFVDTADAVRLSLWPLYK